MLEIYPKRGLIIPIGATQRQALHDHLLRLDPEGRCQRFCHPVDDAHVANYVAGLDLAQHTVIGCFEGGQMRGAAELNAAQWAPSRLVEATLSIEKDWCGQGLEMALLLYAISAARRMGAGQLFLDHLGCREALRRTVAQFEAEMVFADDDCRAWLPLGPSWAHAHGNAHGAHGNAHGAHGNA
jgi:hypothetical protein